MNGRGCYAPFTIDTERLKLPLGVCRVYVIVKNERASKKNMPKHYIISLDSTKLYRTLPSSKTFDMPSLYHALHNLL